jgi:hypothetical protein
MINKTLRCLTPAIGPIDMIEEIRKVTNRAVPSDEDRHEIDRRLLDVLHEAGRSALGMPSSVDTRASRPRTRGAGGPMPVGPRGAQWALGWRCGSEAVVAGFLSDARPRLAAG